MRKAALYARFSSNNQRDESIDAQERAIRKYAEENDIQSSGIYSHGDDMSYLYCTKLVG